MKLTFDWNCVIEAEQQGPQAEALSCLIELHHRGLIEVALLGTSASENTRDKQLPDNAEVFRKRLTALGWQDLPLVPMPAVCGLTFIGLSYWVGDGDEFKKDVDALWQVIAPSVQRDPRSHLPEGMELTDAAIQSTRLKKWRNTWCDVMSAYSHIKAERDMFVTSNSSDFQRKASGLHVLGMSLICTPQTALDTLRSMRLGERD